jgi:metallophosphoesterase (TIGR00282 family)
MKILFLGDIFSRAGRKALQTALHGLKKRLEVDLCVANVENAAGIFGITEKVIDEITEAGVDIMTSGNHVWDKREGVKLLDMRDDILRPANYPPGVPGKGYCVIEVKGTGVAILNLQGRTFMVPIDCPFRCADEILSGLPEDVKVIAVDFHAEATSEKAALGHYLDGRVSAVIGTHTHIPTADECILPGGTAYMTDVGLVGPLDSVIGAKKDSVIDRFIYQLPVRLEMAKGKTAIDAVLVTIDEGSGHATEVQRIRERIEEEMP